MPASRVLACLLLALGGLAVGVVRAADPPTKIHGRVILDANGNGQLDAGETGLKGIAVTDGVQWVLSGDDGSYALTVVDDPVQPFRPARTISVSWPSQHWPTSIWWRRLAELPPDGRLDFGLRSDQQKLPLTITHVTDPHNHFGGVYSALWRDEIGRMTGRVKLAFATGDLGYASEKDADVSFPLIRQFTQSFPVPFFHAIGNHDVVNLHTTEWNKPTDIHGNGAFTKYLGPIRWSFDYAGVHFAGLDWSHREGAKLETSGIEEVAAKWLEADLARVKPPARIYFFMHSGYDKTKQLWPILMRHKVELFLAGHSHRNVDELVEGIPYLMTMNHAGPYKLVNITDDGFQVIHRCLGCKNPGRTHRSNNSSYPRTGICRVAIANLPARRGAHADIKDRTLDRGETPLGDVKAAAIEADVRVEPGTAKAWGLRIGPDAQGKSLELVATADELRCGDLVTDPAREPGQKDDRWHLAIGDKGVSVWVNDHARFDVPYIPTSPVGLTLLARDGAAKFVQADVWQLNPGPPFQVYREK